MKKKGTCRLFVLAALLAATSAFGGEPYQEFTFWDNAPLTFPSTNVSVAIPLESYLPSALTFGLQVVATNVYTNGGQVTLNWQVSNNQTDWFVTSNIVSVLAETNATAVNKGGMFWFTPQIAKFVRLQAIVARSNVNLTAKSVFR